jgi:hypothetical protein
MQAALHGGAAIWRPSPSNAGGCAIPNIDSKANAPSSLNFRIRVSQQFDEKFDAECR